MEPVDSTLVDVEVVWATAEQQCIFGLRVPQGTTLQTAIERSGVLAQIPESDPAALMVGSYGKLRALDSEVRAGERIEIYRPLLADPKAARRARARRKATGRKR